jgi:hypothetical protein
VPAADALAVLDAIEPAQIPAAIARLAARAMLAPRVDAAPDQLLTPAEAAALLHVPVRWIWRNARVLGGVRASPRKLLISRRRVVRWLEVRR